MEQFPKEWVDRFINEIEYTDFNYKCFLESKRNKKYMVWDSEFWQTLRTKKELKAKSGCYALFQTNIHTYERTLLYIGTSKNIRKRFERHNIYTVLERMPDGKNFLFISVRYCPDEERQNLEKELIECHQPPLNREYVWMKELNNG